MAYQTRGFLLPAVSAGADLSADQFKLVKLATGGKVVLCGAGELAVGALENDPALDSAASVVNSGVAKVATGDDLAVGQNVACNASGLAVPAQTGDYIVGQSMADTTAGEICSVLIYHPGIEP